MGSEHSPLELTGHAERALAERGIEQAWVARVLATPDSVYPRDDGTVHDVAPVSERDGRMLRVVTSSSAGRLRVVTAFFDRRLGRKP